MPWAAPFDGLGSHIPHPATISEILDLPLIEQSHVDRDEMLF